MDGGAGTLIVGAGLAGSAVAMHLAAMGEPEVVVIDPDLAGARSSSQLNAGGVRATWWQPVNVELCAATIDELARHAGALAFRQRGYLWLHGPGRWEQAVAHVAMQNRHGRDVEPLSPAEVGRRWPFIDRLDDLAGATWSPRDGLVDPNAVREMYRDRARAAGARFVDRALLTGVRREGGRVVAAEVETVDAEGADRVLRGGRPAGRAEEVACRRLVNAAGPWAARVAELMGAPVPCRAVPRQICLVATRDVDLSALGMVVDSSDVYLHHEAKGLFLAGYSPPGDPPSYSFAYEGRAFFEREIWPRLAHRASAFDRLEHVRGWTGLYELSPDHSAVVGAVPEVEGAFEIHSFSGRGVMQSWAAGLCLAELIATGRLETFPAAAALSRARFDGGGPLLPEELHI